LNIRFNGCKLERGIMRFLCGLLLVLAVVPAIADESSPSPSLEERVRKLEEELEARPVVSFGSGGFMLRTPDGQTQLRIRGLVQADGRAYLGDDKNAIPDTFLLRRVRPIIEATFFGWLDARIMPDFGGNKVVLEDAYLDVHPFAWLRLRAGKFKPPVGLERLQADANIKFIERGLPTNLVPSRDVGAELWGDVAGGLFTYAIGVFNGVVDGVDTPDIDAHDGKDFAARIFVHPLRPLHKAWLDNLGLGIAGTYGKERGTASLPNLASYKTAGQITFFSYLASTDLTRPDLTTVANGDRWRVAPQLYYYGGPVGLLAEYVRSSQDVRRGTDHGATLAQAWQVQVSVLVTPGDRETFETVTPRHPLTLREHGYGAFELVGRYEQLLVGVSGDATFTAYADPTKSANAASGFGFGLNWYANTFFRAAVDYARTDFIGGAKGASRPAENALLGRLQVVF
jgi:phosphate-selective porin OprO/OprP